MYTFKTARISHNESHPVSKPAWNVLEIFFPASIVSPPRSLLVILTLISLSGCCWRCIFVLFLLRHWLLLYCIFSLCISFLLFIASLFHWVWPMSGSKVFPNSPGTSVFWLHLLFSSIVSQVTLFQIFSWFLYSHALDCWSLLPLVIREETTKKETAIIVIS